MDTSEPTVPVVAVPACRAPVSDAVEDESVFMRPSAVALLFGVDAQTVRRWSDSGLLATQRTVGGHRRFRRSDVQALLAQTAGQSMAGPNAGEATT
ncbi:MAG: helix-turn-helix domain-containing protein [Mycobacteriales bacterium]